jgi:DNA-binding HxlR family transcriptional regulator
MRNCELAAEPTAIKCQRLDLALNTLALTKISLLHYVRYENNQPSVEHACAETGQELVAVLRAIDSFGRAYARKKDDSNDLQNGTDEHCVDGRHLWLSHQRSCDDASDWDKGAKGQQPDSCVEGR